ncbi:hypothetical protein [Maridesulfovibrio sp.]|uniref:hypothetical protein n=1 Tax=Maridesulfovibrio sp. TaxID=2795000 RepID=UPI0029F57319|nr:hypothetical protein [Maridesulfovibrio sp.]
MYTIVKDGVAVCGASEVNGNPSEEMKNMSAATGGKIVAVKINKPSINPRMQMHGQYSTIVRTDRVDYNYSVVEISTETVRQNLIDFVGKHAEQRILEFAPYWKQINAITDPDPDLTARIKAVRDASNVLETEIKAMDRDSLSILNIEGWDGWPVSS